jgi:hypothetical protein
LNTGCNGLATAPVWLKNGVSWNDAMLTTFPGFPETGLFSDRFTPGVESVASNLGVGKRLTPFPMPSIS